MPKLIPAVSTEGWEQMIRGGGRTFIRPLHATDVELERRFIEAFSPVLRRFRFFDSMKPPGEALLTKLTVLDPDIFSGSSV